MSFHDSFTVKSVPAAGAQAKDGESLDLVSSLANIRNEFSEAKGDGQGWAQAAKDSGRDFDGSQAKGSGGGDSDAQSKEAKRVPRARSSSTSSLYVRSTLQVPDVDHLLVSIAMLLEQLIQPKVLDYDTFSAAAAVGCGNAFVLDRRPGIPAVLTLPACCGLCGVLVCGALGLATSQQHTTQQRTFVTARYVIQGKLHYGVSYMDTCLARRLKLTFAKAAQVHVDALD